MNKKDAATFLDIGVRSLERYTKEGEITAGAVKGKTGMVVDYAIEELERFATILESRRGTSPSPPVSPEASPPQTFAKPATSSAIVRHQSGQGPMVKVSPDSPTSPRSGKGSPDGVRTSEKWLFSIEEVWQLTGIPTRIIRQAITDGQLEAVRVGRPYRVRPEDLKAWINALYEKARQ